MESKVCAEEPAIEENHLPATHLMDPDDEEDQDSHTYLGLEMCETGLGKV
jgi:hypothetical protein